jgi:hypothetical protein
VIGTLCEDLIHDELVYLIVDLQFILLAFLNYIAVLFGAHLEDL